MLLAILPLSLQPVPILPLMHAISGSLGLEPLADVAVSKDSFPDSLTFFETSGPLALIYFAIGPRVDAFPMRLAIEELPFISVAIGVALHATPTPCVILPLTLVDSSFAILHDAQALTLPIDKLTAIHGLIVVLHPEIGRLP